VLRGYLDRAVARGALLAGGDDYELCFTAPPGARNRIARVGRRIRIALSRIGCVGKSARGAPRLIVRTPDGSALRPQSGGYDHFR